MTLKKSVSEWCWALWAFKYSSLAQLFNYFSPSDKFLQQGLPPTALRTEEQNSESGACPQPNEKQQSLVWKIKRVWCLGSSWMLPGPQFFPSQPLIIQPRLPSSLCGHRVPGAAVPAKAEAQTLPQPLVSAGLAERSVKSNNADSSADFKPGSGPLDCGGRTHQKPSQGAAPHLLESWYANQLRQMWGRGTPGLTGSLALAEGGGARISLVQWLRQTGRERSWCCPQCVGAEPGVRADCLLGHLEATPTGNLCALVGPASPVGPNLTWQRSATRTWERLLCLQPGRPLRRDFGDFCSFCSKYFDFVFQPKTIFYFSSSSFLIFKTVTHISTPFRNPFGGLFSSHLK